MRRLLILFLIFGVMVSLSMCIESTWKHPEGSGSEVGGYNGSSEDSNVVDLVIGGQPVQLVLRTSVKEALSTKLINTNDSDIVESYLSYKKIYIEYNRSLTFGEGGVSVMDLSLKLKFLEPLYGRKVISNINDSEREVLILKVVKGNRSATIEKVDNRTYIIEGNSLEELDKAVSRFVLAVYKGVAEKS